jgi:hypothetical protein
MAFHPAPIRARSRAKTYAAGLKAKLCIAPDQVVAWSALAGALSCNHRRMASDTASGDEPFGALGDRLAALERIGQAGRELMDVLSPEQQHIAAQVLPLCCLARHAASAQ